MGGQHLRQATQVSGVWVPVPERHRDDSSAQIKHRVLNMTFSSAAQWTHSPLPSLTLICPPGGWSCVGCSPRWPWPPSLCLSPWRWVHAWRLSPAGAEESASSRSQEGRLQTALLWKVFLEMDDLSGGTESREQQSQSLIIKALSQQLLYRGSETYAAWCLLIKANTTVTNSISDRWQMHNIHWSLCSSAITVQHSVNKGDLWLFP